MSFINSIVALHVASYRPLKVGSSDTVVDNKVDESNAASQQAGNTSATTPESVSEGLPVAKGTEPAAAAPRGLPADTVGSPEGRRSTTSRVPAAGAASAASATKVRCLQVLGYRD